MGFSVSFVQIVTLYKSYVILSEDPYKIKV